MLFDDVNYLYNCLLTPIIKKAAKINKIFQAANADPEKMTRQLHMHYASLKLRVFDFSGNHLAISKVDFGSRFQSKLICCSYEHSNSVDSIAFKKDAKSFCYRPTFAQFPFQNLVQEQYTDQIGEKFSCSHEMKKQCFSLELQIILFNFGLQFVVFKTVSVIIHTNIWLHMHQHV